MDEFSLPHQELDPTGLTFEEAARESGLTVDGLRFVSDALVFAPRLVDGITAGEHIRGPLLCLAVAEYAREVFGDEAFDVLSEWGLTTSEDVGRAVSALVQSGLMEASSDDSPADFAGLALLSAFPVHRS